MESILALAYSCGSLHAAEVQEVMSVLQVSGSDNLEEARCRGLDLRVGCDQTATFQASAVRPLGRRGLISAVPNRSSATPANSEEICLRHLSSCSTEEASDHIKWGATSCSRDNGVSPASLKHAVMTVEASTTSKISARYGRSELPPARRMRCWVPTRVALKRPDRIQRRTVSGSRLVRRAASGTVSIVA